MTLSPARMTGKLSEKQIQTAVMAHWRAFGVPGSIVAAIPNARAAGQAGLTRGLPDLLVLAPGLPGGVGFLELKTDNGLVRESQADFAALCHLRGVPWEVTFGRDEPIAILEKWGAVRAMRKQ